MANLERRIEVYQIKGDEAQRKSKYYAKRAEYYQQEETELRYLKNKYG